MTKLIQTAAIGLALAACGGGADGSADTSVSGAATHQDAQKDASGQSQEPTSPAPQSAGDPMRIELAVDGSGSLEGLEPQCSLTGTSGAFQGLYSGEAVLDNNGLYAAAVASSEARFETVVGCKIRPPEITAVTRVVVRGELSATAANCTGYCAAKARHYGEVQCQGNPNTATCRGDAQAAYSASCQARCTTANYRIVAETELSAAVLADISARNLTGAALGDLTVDLRFARIEDGQRQRVSEFP